MVMTEFGGLEKQMLRDMVILHKSQNLCIYSWLGKLFDDKVSFKWVPDQWNYRIEVYSNELGENEILPKIKYFYFLYKRLEKINLIDLDSSKSSTIDVNFKIFNTHEFSLTANSEEILYEFLSKCGCQPILVSNYLIDLVENDFKTPEQIRFEKQLVDANEKHSQVMGEAKKQVKYSRRAFYFSIVAFLASLVFGIIQMCSDTTIDSDQFNQIKQTIKQTTPPDVIKTKITNDTLTTRIVEKPKAK
jgi:cell division protein FtsL